MRLLLPLLFLPSFRGSPLGSASIEAALIYYPIAAANWREMAWYQEIPLDEVLWW